MKMRFLDKFPFYGTFSIAASDPEAGDVGVAVASKYFAVGSVVPWVRAGVGAIATQSWANTTYGPNGLNLLESGKSPEETLTILTEADDLREKRQVGIVSAQGVAANRTGAECMDWAGHWVGKNCAIQGNLLAGEQVIQAMTDAFENTAGDLADRLMAALLAGDNAGGDNRGKQSAGLIVARKQEGFSRYQVAADHRLIDIRCDDHPEPTRELARLLNVRLGRN